MREDSPCGRFTTPDKMLTTRCGRYVRWNLESPSLGSFVQNSSSCHFLYSSRCLPPKSTYIVLLAVTVDDFIGLALRLFWTKSISTGKPRKSAAIS
uniref:Uncharacterized protein n=1 Tax=Parascaris equorum TaxID=6256 RepID=A0A914RJV0_PAREQ